MFLTLIAYMNIPARQNYTFFREYLVLLKQRLSNDSRDAEVVVGGAGAGQLCCPAAGGGGRGGGRGRGTVGGHLYLQMRHRILLRMTAEQGNILINLKYEICFSAPGGEAVHLRRFRRQVRAHDFQENSGQSTGSNILHSVGEGDREIKH